VSVLCKCQVGRAKSTARFKIMLHAQTPSSIQSINRVRIATNFSAQKKNIPSLKDAHGLEIESLERKGKQTKNTTGSATQSQSRSSWGARPHHPAAWRLPHFLATSRYWEEGKTTFQTLRRRLDYICTMAGHNRNTWTCSIRYATGKKDAHKKRLCRWKNPVIKKRRF